MTKHGLFLLLALFFSIHVSAHGQDSLCVKADSMAVKPVEGKKKRDLFHAIGHAFTKVFRGFNELDTNYIEPQHYDYTVMLQNTNTFEEYTIESKSGQRFSFAPDWSAKVGPYAAWRWLFLGYSFDVKHLEKSNRKTEFDLSFYSSMLGICNRESVELVDRYHQCCTEAHVGRDELTVFITVELNLTTDVANA